MRVSVEGELSEGVSSKDVVLHIIGVIGTAGGTGSVIEFAGSAIRSLSMEARMSICNMSIGRSEFLHQLWVIAHHFQRVERGQD
jgi:homoaconitase/3-isopropylmalate dehydratase large subunit